MRARTRERLGALPCRVKRQGHIVAPAFAVGALMTPGLIALFSTASVPHHLAWLNSQTGVAHGGVFAVQNALLTLGLSSAAASCALATYHWSLARRLLHLLIFCVLLELFYRFAYGGPVTSGILLSVPETSRRETGELLAGHAVLTGSLTLVALLALYSLLEIGRAHV